VACFYDGYSPKEFEPLRVKITREVHERVERYREFCGAVELADLVERALVYCHGQGC
jgi:hypothetical protein